MPLHIWTDYRVGEYQLLVTDNRQLTSKIGAAEVHNTQDPRTFTKDLNPRHDLDREDSNWSLFFLARHFIMSILNNAPALVPKGSVARKNKQVPLSITHSCFSCVSKAHLFCTVVCPVPFMPSVLL